MALFHSERLPQPEPAAEMLSIALRKKICHQ
jgi:hypothetical protein